MRKHTDLESPLQMAAAAMDGGKLGEVAESATNAVRTAVDYVREQDVREMLANVRQLARRHPGATLLIASALGFLLARTLSRP